jgi:hypothetical protein
MKWLVRADVTNTNTVEL